MTATLAEVAAALPGAGLVPPSAGEVGVLDATHDSRHLGAGWLFCAVVGQRTDGHDHATAAAADGAAALLVERHLDVAVPQIVVPSVRAAMGPAAAVIHRHPSRDLTLIGTTGTNGKTTVSYLLEGAIAAAGWGSGVIGTVETRVHGTAVPGIRTTPEGTDLQRLLRELHRRGVDAVAAEVSSHGLDLHRVDGCRFAVGVYTNLSRDHLDWHGTMERYLAAKARLFTPGLTDHGVVFLDGPWAEALLARVEVPVTTLGWDRAPQGVSSVPEVTIVGAETGVTGGRARLEGLTSTPLDISTRLPGRFNLANAATAVVAAVRAGVPAAAAVAGVAAAPGAPGRLERVAGDGAPAVFVDYAHTPDAVRAVVEALSAARPADGRLTVVLGCGGDRDRDKRGPMGAAAAAADRAVLTTDNPRSEDPAAILATVVAGARAAVAAGAPAELIVEPDRRRAIAAALAGAGAGDVVLIAGKGHEAYQEFADHRIDFDDRVVAAELLAMGRVHS